MGSCLWSDGRSSSSSPLSPSSPVSGAKQPRKGSRKRQGSRRSSFDTRREEQLHRIPGRMFLNGGSSVASLFTQQGKKGLNQDAMIVWENFGSRTDTVFCGVFDGHGPYGHMVARRVRDSLPLKLSAHWEVNVGSDDCRESTIISHSGSMSSEETSSICLDDEPGVSTVIEEKDKHPEIFTTLKESFLKAFKVMDKELKLHTNIDCFCSGTTAVTLVKQGQDLVIGNVGDSRAVLGTRDQNDCLIAVQLTVDLKPNLPREAERIRKCRGRVFALQNEPEVARVWLPNNDSPGLAMARAFGDFCLKDFGLISVPEISYRHITKRDEFIVLATDGVWDVLSNKEVVDIVSSAPARSSAAHSLVESAVGVWRLKYPTSKIDDCAVVCLFLDTDASNNSSNLKTKVRGSPYAPGAGSGKEELSTRISTDRSGTTRSGSLILRDIESPRKQLPSDGNATVMNSDEWSALDGVSRVNTLITLPRFVAVEQQPASTQTRK
ncbi:probable protein phosphatase 2C 33 isoform X1 [Phoenix dactylifera]|uniref:protein-serine/threonine phosphatase n=1 Tax=Phoenix dactylifera TaxID=42345 RepID=A0A8B8ZTJ0_PHODC|nr:probable protein phosphatase 2C 33 isoform X1 [Phoenix dactylifera]